ncbi:MAG: tetratricopeptide repeat protein [Thermoleophilia bacterium]|jgi:tetratricopeptide (TPR) repeat protein
MKSPLKPPDPVAQRDNSGFRRHAAMFRYAVTPVAIFAIILALIPWYSAYLQDKSLREAEDGYQVDALHTAESAQSWDPVSVNALFVLAGAEQRIGWQQNSRKTLEKATRLEPLNYATWETLAVEERNTWSMPDQAARDFARAIALDPQNKELRQMAGLPATTPGS